MEGNTRFLMTPMISPSKIPILVLIRGYCHKKIPQRCIPPVLSILVELIESDPDKKPTLSKSFITKNTDGTNESNDLLKLYFPSLDDILSSINVSVRSFFKTNDTVQLNSTEEDIALISQYIQNDLWSLKSYDDFYTFLISTSALIVDPAFETNLLKNIPLSLLPSSDLVKPLYSSSFLGSFVSALSIVITTMSFEEGIRIWKGFLQYREDSKYSHPSYCTKKDNILEYSFENSIIKSNSLDKQNTKNIVYSHMDLSSLFQSQVIKLQKNSIPPSDDLINLMKALNQSNKTLMPSLYHVEYLDHWRKGNYDQTFDSLHRYFDYMMSSRKQYFYHYALLALATLHSSFGANKDALRAIDEAILVARENKDLDCLNYLLTWLLNFMISKPHLFIRSDKHPPRLEILNFLKLKTKEIQDLSLQAVSLQFEVVLLLLEGSCLKFMMENLIKTFYLILNFNDITELRNLFVTACQVSDTIFKRIGYPIIGDIYLDMAIDHARKNRSEFDIIVLYIRRSANLFFSGQIEESFNLLNSVEEKSKKSFSLTAKWNMAYHSLKFYEQLNKCEYSQCELLLEKMDSLSATIDDQEITNEYLYQRALYFIKLCNVQDSYKIITKQIECMKENPIAYNNFWFIRFQVLQAKMYVTCTQYPDRSLTLLLNALRLSHKGSLMFNYCESVICLCELLLKSDPLNSTSDVQILLNELLPKVIEINRNDLISDSYLLMAKALFMESEIKEQKSLKIQNDSFKILKCLRIAYKGYESIEDHEKIHLCLKLEMKIAKFFNIPELEYDLASKLNTQGQ